MGNDVRIDSLKGKTCLVTGSGKGLGSAIAIEAGRQGANVVLHYRSSEASAQEVFRQVQETGCDCVMVQADFASPEGVNRLYQEAEKAFGGVDVLVNNAALQYNLNFDDYDAEKIQSIFRVNLGGYFLMSQKVLPYMREKGWGRIINISSVHAKRPTTFDFGYSMTKGAIKMLTRELALETARQGITVNAIELGAVYIGIKSGNPPEILGEDRRRLPHLFDYKEDQPWGRIIQPEDVAPAVMFLASEGARYINGASLRLDDAAMLL